MTVRPPRLPDGFVVTLHDDLRLDVDTAVRGSRVMRLAAVARGALEGRTIRVDSPLTAALAGRLLDLDLGRPVLPEADDRVLGDVTVVIPVRDRADGVARLLDGLAGVVPCVVVDDASRDASRLDAIARRHGATMIRLDDNVGPAAARNVGLRQVATPFVAFVDADVEVSVRALARLASHLADPGLAAVAPRVRTRGGRRWFERYEDAAGGHDLGPDAATVRPWSDVTYVPSACLVARVAALGDGFDASLRCGEDVDLVWRLQRGGWRVRHAAEVGAWHDARTTFRGWWARRRFYGTSAAPLAARHGDRVAPAVLVPEAAAGAALILTRRAWALPLAIGAGAVAVRRTEAEPGALAAATARQVTRGALRHWWPISAALAVASPRFRRTLALLAVADGLLAHRAARPDLDPLRFTAGRRAGDLAYGAGLWAGAWRARSAAALLPRWITGRTR